MDVAANNIANAATPSYRRQRLDLVERASRATSAGPVGQGVAIDGVSALRDPLLDLRVRAGETSLGAMIERSSHLSRAEDVFSEPHNGLSTVLNELWSSFEDLGNDPNDGGRRVVVINKLNDVVGRITTSARDLDAIATDARAEIGAIVDDANSWLQRLGQLNGQILSSGAVDPTLTSQRDALLDLVARALGATSRVDDNGGTSVSLDGHELLSGARSNSISYNPGTDSISVGSQIVTAGGEVSGVLQFLTTDLETARSGINLFAAELTGALNFQHNQGFYAVDTPGAGLLTHNGTDAAGTLSLAMSDPNALAASDTAAAPFPVHNGENAQRLAELRTNPVAGGGTITLTDRYLNLLTSLAATTAAAESSLEQQALATGALQAQRDAAVGVNTEEEMIDLLAHQRAFEAASRVITAIDEMLDVLINRTGVVGR